ncbi:heme-binding protein [Candidatus Peregrinibacteria bacterium]|nr:MAG: heme-binding protein [Candidatus Peregrinibacteria bacterium]
MPKKLFSNHKKMNILWMIAIIAAALFLVWVAFGYFGSRVETLSYTVLSSDKEYEIRELPEHIIAETTVSGNFDDASGEAFNILAGYIFGNNEKKQSISMTSPVVENEYKKIAMTAPVVEQDSGANQKIFSFVMPAEYTMETLPEPLDKRITIKKVESKKIAVLTFSGFYSEKKINEKKQLLKQYLDRDGLEYSTVSWAGYNPPWTPPFMRRLEVWAELK